MFPSVWRGKPASDGMKAPLLCCLLVVLSFSQSRATVPSMSEGFESCYRDILDANSATSANRATNGGPGNPWWGEYPPDLVVVGPETNIVPGIITNFVSPHGGTNMVRGGSLNDDRC